MAIKVSTGSMKGKAVKYVIRDRDGDYWSNELGWTEFRKLADTFSEEERRTLNLPFEGYWEEIQERRKEMICIKSWIDMKQYGFDYLTGEACTLGIRGLVDLTREGRDTLLQFLGMPSTARLSPNFNQGGVASAMLCHDILEPLAVFCLFERSKAACVYRQHGHIYGITSDDRQRIEDYVDRFIHGLSEKQQDIESWSRELVEEYYGKCGRDPELAKIAYIRQEHWNEATITQKYLYLLSMPANYGRNPDKTFRTWSRISGQPSRGANAIHAMTGRYAGDS